VVYLKGKTNFSLEQQQKTYPENERKGERPKCCRSRGLRVSHLRSSTLYPEGHLLPSRILQESTGQEQEGCWKSSQSPQGKADVQAPVHMNILMNL